MSNVKESMEAEFEKLLSGGMAMSKIDNDLKSSNKNRVKERTGTKRQKRVGVAFTVWFDTKCLVGCV